jgi:coatomer protein complex subunit alpha (xenin)
MKIVASAADDKTIKLCRLSGNKHWEMDTLKGHTNNVSCVIFHPRLELLLSNSEDKTLRLWDLNRRV